MAYEIVKQIIDTEKEGEDIIKKAQSIAQDIQKRAREDAESIINKAKTDAEKYYNNIISKYEKDAALASKPILEKRQEARTKLANLPSDLLNSAVNMVIERIVNSHGNS